MRFLQTALAAVLYALGWLAGKVSLAAGWCWSAIAVGWDDARHTTPRADSASVPVPPGR